LACPPALAAEAKPTRRPEAWRAVQYLTDIRLRAKNLYKVGRAQTMLFYEEPENYPGFYAPGADGAGEYDPSDEAIHGPFTAVLND
jgi:hypothetical protein